MMHPKSQNPRDDSENHNKNNILKSISELIPSANTRKIPPLDSWSPTRMHDFDIIIKDNGDWYHEGEKMTRQSLVDLFASVLWGEIDETGKKTYFLKTPSDLYRIQVEDTPLLIHRVDEVIKDGVSWLVFGTTNGDEIVLDDDSVPYFQDFIKDGRTEQRLYIDTRFNLTARMNANVLYHLVEMGKMNEMNDAVTLTLTSGGKTHQLVVDK
ncbi:MAG: DUF1285 domain-containing protein [Moraxella sp.]|nr:DUF1285 domain-containing protein [Moraxella sp.]